MEVCNDTSLRKRAEKRSIFFLLVKRYLSCAVSISLIISNVETINALELMLSCRFGTLIQTKVGIGWIAFFTIGPIRT